jgi:hypothetical protein
MFYNGSEEEGRARFKPLFDIGEHINLSTTWTRIRFLGRSRYGYLQGDSLRRTQRHASEHLPFAVLVLWSHYLHRISTLNMAITTT